MAKKKSYDAYVRQQMGDIIDQLQLPNLYKQSLKERWLDQMIWADKKAAQSRKSYYRLRLTTIVGGVILPALVGISVQLGQDSQFFRVWFPPLTFLLSQVIAVSVAIEEFCKFGDRWRDYRKMAEDLKSEGWQYLQSSGPYEYGMDHVPESFQSNGQRSASVDDFSMSGLSSPSRSFELNNNSKHQKTHLQNYAQFANRIESIIKNDVQGYIANLVQQQAKQDIQAQKVLAQAQAVATDKTLIAQLATLDPGYRDPNAVPVTTAPLMTAARPNAAPIAGAVGTLKVHQDTFFKLSTQAAQTLSDTQKVHIPNGSAFGVNTYAIADNNHFQVTFNQGVGAENRNTWYVFAPHVAVVGADNKPATPTPNPTVATVSAPATSPVAVATAPAPAAIVHNGVVQLAVPYLSQTDNAENPLGSCNVTSIAMCLTYLGAKRTNPQKQFEDELQDWMATKGLDRHAGEHLAQAVEAYGCQDNYTTKATLEQVKQWLAKGNPIVIHGWFTKSGHIVCGIGYNDKGLIIHDPYGEWHEGNNYDRNDESNPHKGKALTYSYDMIHRTCMTEEQFWVHFISRAGHPVSPASSIQPMQLSQSVNTSRLTNFSAPPSNSQPSHAIPPCGIELIKKWEGYDANAYPDPIALWDVPTIGYGTTKYPDGSKVKQGDTTTRDKAEQYLLDHIAKECTSALEKIPTWGQMNANQRGALYSFAYNLGAAFYKAPQRESITMVCDSPNQWHNHAWVEEQFVKYCNPGTSAQVGLQNRRREEAKLFCT